MLPMPVIAATALRTPFGDLAATRLAWEAGDGPRHSLGLLVDDLVDLGREILARASCEACLVATTKADLDTWLPALERGGLEGGPADLAARVEAGLGLPTQAVAAACASGTAALALAGGWIRQGRHRSILVLAGDDAHAFIRDGFTALRALDPTGCRPFAEDRGGLALGSARAALALSAEGEGPLLSGWGGSLDGRHLTAPDREARGLEAACRQALGGQSPTLILAHGTGTRFNDAAEATCYRRLAPGVAVTATKGVLGHTLAAAGLVDAILVADSLDRGSCAGVAATTSVAEDARVPLLPVGVHALESGPVLVVNAGFAGINVAVAIGGTEGPGSEPQATVVERSVVLDGTTWRRSDGATGAFAREDDPRAPHHLGRPRAPLVLGRGEASWGRMDQAARLLSTLTVAIGPLPTTCGIVLWTEAGCAESDRAFEASRRAAAPDAQRFPYTLSSTPIGEAAIRAGIHGPGLVIAHADEATARAAADALLGPDVPAVLLARVEADLGPQQAWAELRVRGR